MKKVLKVSCKYSQKGSQKMVEKVIRVGLQSKYSGPSPAFVDCQKDSQTTVRNGTHVKPVLLAVKIFAVHTSISSQNWSLETAFSIDLSFFTLLISYVPILLCI